MGFFFVVLKVRLTAWWFIVMHSRIYPFFTPSAAQYMPSCSWPVRQTQAQETRGGSTAFKSFHYHRSISIIRSALVALQSTIVGVQFARRRPISCAGEEQTVQRLEFDRSRHTLELSTLAYAALQTEPLGNTFNDHSAELVVEWSNRRMKKVRLHGVGSDGYCGCVIAGRTVKGHPRTHTQNEQSKSDDVATQTSVS